MLTGLRKVTMFGPVAGFLMSKEEYVLAVVVVGLYGFFNALSKFAHRSPPV